MKITKNFTLEEFTRSQTATRYGIDNTPDKVDIKNIHDLTKDVLQPVRNALGPVYINSGYRCPALNIKVGGSSTSQHMRGQAADIVVTDHSVAEVFNYIADNLEYDQLIYEFGSWVHVSYKKGNNRMQKLEAYKDVNNRTQYRNIERA